MFVVSNYAAHFQNPSAFGSATDPFKVIENFIGGNITTAYRLLENGTSTIFRIFAPRFDTDVAVKLVDKTQMSVQQANTFLYREMEISLMLRHEFICHTLDVLCPNPSTVVLISEFYPGGNLLDFTLSNARTSERDKVIIFRQLIEAVQFMHQRLYTHRDIKMENIFLCKYGNVKLGDFGFARQMRSRLGRSDSFCGTRPYSSPDIAWKREYDPFANDWYSCGVVLYTLLCGSWPFKVTEVTSKPPWPSITFDSKAFSSDSTNLLKRLLDENSYTRADYEICLRSAFMCKHNQGYNSKPIVRHARNSLFEQ
ncbi:Protein kinase domain-containing protein [Aphelenchoides besseyi]|nr:Protein kinase domain-containing protein [Aphelenchoides besseyi]